MKFTHQYSRGVTTFGPGTTTLMSAPTITAPMALAPSRNTVSRTCTRMRRRRGDSSVWPSNGLPSGAMERRGFCGMVG